MSFEECVARLRKGLSAGLPGAAAQLAMAPEYRQDLALLSISGKKCRKAGVLALLTPVDGEASLVFTLRHAHLPHHAGQVSFPGGRREPGETLLEAALREAYEEVGLADPVEVLGALTPLFIPPSNFCVYPFAATADPAPALVPHEAEVEAILHVPVSRLLNPKVRTRERRELPGRTGWVPFFSVDEYQIWGATAMMLAELLALIEKDRA